jgi:hypothetical protein
VAETPERETTTFTAPAACAGVVHVMTVELFVRIAQTSPSIRTVALLLASVSPVPRIVMTSPPAVMPVRGDMGSAAKTMS